MATLKTIWRLGLHAAQTFLNKTGFVKTELDLDESVTILKPFGVSLNIDLDQQYVNELEEQANEQEADNFENINDLPL